MKFLRQIIDTLRQHSRSKTVENKKESPQMIKKHLSTQTISPYRCTYRFIGHRGGINIPDSETNTRLKYENTIEAIIHAIENGLREVEFDLALSKDGPLILTHGELIEYLESKGEKLDKTLPVEAFDFETLNAACERQNITLSTFEMVLNYFIDWNKKHPNDPLRLNPELKGKGTCDPAIALMNSKVPEAFKPLITFTTFKKDMFPNLLKRQADLNGASMSLLVDNYDQTDDPENEYPWADVLSLIEDNNLDTIGIYRGLLNEERVKELTRKGIKHLRIFSVLHREKPEEQINNPKELHRLLDLTHEHFETVSFFVDNPEVQNDFEKSTPN